MRIAACQSERSETSRASCKMKALRVFVLGYIARSERIA
jgi:hypothetical protein